MTERITKANVERAVENLNRRMEQRGSKYRYQAHNRNGYTALDRFRRDPDDTLNLPDSVPGRGAGWLAHSLVRIGSKREIHEYLSAMMVALDDANELESPVHKATPATSAPNRCTYCGQEIRSVPGGQGPTWVHAASGAVAAPNPRP